MIHVSVNPDHLPQGGARPLTVTLLNDGSGVCIGIVLRLAFPHEIVVIKGDDRIELERLEPGASRSYPFVVQAKAPGWVVITSDNFSYCDNEGESHRREDLRIPLGVDPAETPAPRLVQHPADSRAESKRLRTRIEGLEDTLLVQESNLRSLIREEAMYGGVGIPPLIRNQLRGLRDAVADLERQLDQATQQLAALDGSVEVSSGGSRACAHDVFICHASEDKLDVARPLALALRKRGWRVWLDETELLVGDGLRRKIDEGIRLSRYGIVILSPNFFSKNWAQYELDGLTDRELSGPDVVILPVWHNIAHDEIAAQSPSLAGKIAAHTAEGIDVVADKIVRRLESGL